MSNDEQKEAKCKITSDGFILNCPCGLKHDVTITTNDEGKVADIKIETTFSKQKEIEIGNKFKRPWFLNK